MKTLFSLSFYSRPVGAAQAVAVCSLLLLHAINAHPAAAPDTLDPTFKAAVSGAYVYSMAVDCEQRIILGGNFTQVNGTRRNNIARLREDGTLDPTFDPGSGASGEVISVASTEEGKVVMGGLFTSVNRVPRNRVARLNADGSVDATFDIGSGADNVVRVIRMQADGKILVGGQFTKFNGQSRNCLVRLNSDGTLDPEFKVGTGFGGLRWVCTILIQPDGKIIVGGDFTSYDNHPCGSIARLNPDGTFDPTFNSGKGTTSDNPIISAALQPDGKIIIGGSFNHYQGVSRVNIARLLPDGQLDTEYKSGKGISGGLYSMIQCVLAQPDGKVFIGGSFDRVNGVARSNVVLLNADGSIDTSFAPKMSNPVRAIVSEGRGAILLGGEFVTVNGVAASRIARLQGAADPGGKLRATRSLGPNGACCRLTGSGTGTVIEASLDLVHWQPIVTNVVASAEFVFDEPVADQTACRFYRVR
jgi:uncharacterized delta-60 repeat protein